MTYTKFHKIAEDQGIPLRTLEQAKEAVKWAKGDQTMIRLMVRHGRLTPEALRYLETLLVVRVAILPGQTWRGTTYFEETKFDMSPEYAKHVVEVLKVAKYV